MFNKKLNRQVADLDHRLGHTDEYIRTHYYELRTDIERLVEALGLTKETTHTVKYVRKGGPEKP